MHASQWNDADRKRLFTGVCWALVATSVAFATVGAVMIDLKREFILTNAEVGYIGGAALWGFAVSQLLFSPFVDKFGFRFLLRLAFAGHLAGVLLMMAATGFWQLFFGALIIAMANGLVEAAGNPLVATLYPQNKTVRLNQFHVWFPGGILIGGVIAWLLDWIGLEMWQLKLALILIPTCIYGIVLLRQVFPPSENAAAGVSMKEMFRASFTSPLLLLLLFCVMITASTELGPNRWVPAVLEAGGIPGILVLAYINGLMGVLRYKAGTVVHRLSPTGVLFYSTILAAIGLFWLSLAETIVWAFISATFFAVGVCYLFPTLYGIVSERVPRSGALGLGLVGAVGMGVVGLFTSPQMGAIADRYGHDVLPVQETVTLMEDVTRLFPAVIEEATSDVAEDIIGAAHLSQEVLDFYSTENRLPENLTSNALRSIIDSETAVTVAGGSPETLEVTSRAVSILAPSDNYGGRMSFRWIVPFTALVSVIFGLLYWHDRRNGRVATPGTPDQKGKVEIVA